jgi:hypothetical protein
VVARARPGSAAGVWLQGSAAAAAALQGQSVAAQGKQVHGGLHRGGEGEAGFRCGRVAAGFQPLQMQEHRVEQACDRVIVCHQGDAELRQGLGPGEGVELLADGMEAVPHPQLPDAR